MAAAVVKFFTFVNGVGRELQSSSALEPIFKTISVSSNGSDNGTKITEVSGKFDFNAKKLSNVAAGSASGEVLTFELIGANSGIAPLDSGGKVPVANLPNSIMEYQGVYNATTNTPTLVDGTGNTGDVYKVSVAGAGVNSLGFVVGDYAIYNGSTWEKAHSGADAVVSVNGASGVVVLTTTNIAEGTNLYYTSARFSTAFAAKTTDDLTEGSTNLYFTTTRARTAAVVNSLGGSQTDQAPSVASVNAALAAVVSAPTVTLTNAEGGATAHTVRQLVFQSAFGSAKLLASGTGGVTQDSLILLVKDATIADTASGAYYLPGQVISGFSGGSFTVGSPVYASKTTPGAFQLDQTGFVSGDNVIRLGTAVSATSLLFNPRVEYQLG